MADSKGEAMMDMVADREVGGVVRITDGQTLIGSGTVRYTAKQRSSRVLQNTSSAARTKAADHGLPEA